MRRVLLLDSPAAHARFRRLVEPAGWSVDATSDPTEAFGRCLEYRYEAILLQLAMRQATELLLPLRELQRDAAFVLIQEATQRLVAVPPPDPGIVGLLRKPFTEGAVLGVLERAARLSRARRRFGEPTSHALRCSARALWVGDDATFRELGSAWQLAKVALVLVQARSLGQACERLHAESFEVVLTDLTLPDAWGLDSVSQLAAHPAQPPIVVMTRVYDDALVSQALRAGARAFIPLLPVDRPRLEAAVISALLSDSPV
jgi:CheY-like chemotaxis protein